MNEEERSNPEELLNAVKKEEEQSNKGRLKIFFGMSAGVGKTYAMLEEAHEMQRAGVDVVVGIVDTHGRGETARLLDGLKIIPELIVSYRGMEFKELDLDAVIRLQPQLVLVDELAHSNIPGLRHAKRWQDVFEILDNGIDVYTTLNVQHLESLNDTVAGIVEVSVRETVPDLVVENAAAIQFVDLTPDELLQRLKEGKVYLGEQSKIASQNFFQKDRLTALREIALRYAAEKVDRDLRYWAMINKRVLEWKPREKFLVAISHSPHTQKLIRTTRRLASNINAPWIAVYINTGRVLGEKDNNQLMQNLQLARDLGAEVATINDPSIVEGIKRIARQKGITQIILGRTPKRSIFNIFKGLTLLDQLSAECTDIDVHVIRQEPLTAKYRRKFILFPGWEQLNSYVFIFLCVCLLTGVNWMLLPFIGYKVIGVIFLISILLLSLFFKKGPIFIASLLYAIVWDVFFIPPIGQFEITSNEDTALLVLYVLTSVATGILVDRAREHKEMLVKSEESVRALYDIVRQIAIAPSTEEMFKSVQEHLGKIFNGEFEILIKLVDNGLILNKPMKLLSDENEKRAALWVFENGKEAGWSTETLAASKNLYIPLKGPREIVGILVFKPKTNQSLTLEQKNFLYTASQQLTSYLERVFYEERTKQHETIQQIGKIHKTILDLFSYEFESPMKTAKNALEVWKQKTTSKQLLEEDSEIYQIEKSFEELNKILSHISVVTQFSEGMMPIHQSVGSIEELIKECCDSVDTTKSGHEIKINIQKDLPLFSFDFYLIHVLLYNLLINVLEFSQPSSTIDVEAKRTNGFVVLSVSSGCLGVPQEQLDMMFERQYPLSKTTSLGTSLGFAISKTIAEAHHGYLKVEILPAGGAKFLLYLPISTKMH